MTRESEKPSRKASLFFGDFLFEAETALYVLLSIADLLITNHLLQHRGEGYQFVESNPVAREIINHWGPRGMVYFKFGMVAIVVLITQIIARYRPSTARLVLFFAIVMMIYVVVFSVRLFMAHAG